MLWSCGRLYPGSFHIKVNTAESRLYCTSAFPITLCPAKPCQDAWIRCSPGTGVREISKKACYETIMTFKMLHLILKEKHPDLWVKLASIACSLPLLCCCHKWLQWGLRMDLGEVWTNRFDGALRHSTTKRSTCGSPLCVAYGDMKKFTNKPN